MRQVTVVGGGLAGMTAALRLAERALSVQILEASPRLGGKAGADRGPFGFDEHGYHIFPAWYVNTRALLAELGISSELVDLDAAFWLRAGEYPGFRTLKQPASGASFLANLSSGVMRPEDLLLFYLACLDLAAQPPRRLEALDQYSLTGFLRSRPYATDRLAESFHDAVLKSVSAPGFQVSAATLKRVVSFWLRHPRPLSSVLNGDLQTRFIEPFAARLRATGCTIRTGAAVSRIVVGGKRIVALETTDSAGSINRVTSDYFVLALPVERLARLVDDDLQAAAPSLGHIKYVRTAPMAALNIYLPDKIDALPKGHVSLVGSRFGLSFIDVSAIWSGHHQTVINAIASDVSDIAGVSQALQQRLLLDDFARFLPFVIDPAARVILKPNVDTPLFMSSVGVWSKRPVGAPVLANATIAGDFVRTPVDLASMEGAIWAGHQAADAVARMAGVPPLTSLPVPSTVPSWMLRPLLLAAYPLGMVCRYISNARVSSEPAA